MRREPVKRDHHSAEPNFSQCAALCFRAGVYPDSGFEVLLITSRETGRWVIPKGWSMQKKKPHQVARIEAWEEAGVRGQVHKEPFGHYSYEKKVADGALLPCRVQVHLLTVSELHDDFPEKGQRQMRWISPEDAAGAVDEPELQQLFLSFRHQ